jgi:hypothetical protein
MNLRRLQLTVLLVALFVFAIPAISQTGENLIFISVTQVANTSNDNVCGVKTGGTYCTDAGLGETGLPPKPPAGVFDVRFVDHRPDPCLDQGQKLHLQEYEAKEDTFQLAFQKGDGAYNFVISWTGSQLASQWSALRIEDGLGLGLINVNMLTDPDHQITVTQTFIGAVNIIGTPIVSPVSGVTPVNSLIPDAFALNQNYPNPFNPSTTIKFAVEKASSVDVAVFDILGKRIATLASEELNPGFYTTTWNGMDDNGIAVSSGVYYVRMTATDGKNINFSDVNKLVLMK